MLSKAASVVAGILVTHFYSDGFFPDAHAAWSWGCTIYEEGTSKAAKYMAVGATDGPKCSDNSILTCSCPASPCEGKNAATPSNLVCAGAGDDKGTSGCFKLHHTYGTPIHSAVAGRAAETDTVTDACGKADVIKVYGNAAGLKMLGDWGVLTADIIDNSTQPASAEACQTLCAGNTDCKFFTFNGQGAADPNYGYFTGLCILQKALTCDGSKYSTFHGAVAGPATCSETKSDTATSKDETKSDAALKDIVDTAVAAGFTTLAAALTQADLVTTLKGSGPFTVFAPTDDAFLSALKALDLTEEELLGRADLSSILTYHVVSGSVKSTDLTDGMKADTVNGAKVTITIDGTTVKVNDAKVTTADVMASNGVIHIIDKVLLPPAAGAATTAPKESAATTTKGTSPEADFAQTPEHLAPLTVGAMLAAMLFA